jgi:hypothetical protein
MKKQNTTKSRVGAKARLREAEPERHAELPTDAFGDADWPLPVLIHRTELVSTSKENTATPAGPFTHSENYRNVSIRGEKYVLTPRQAEMIKILDEAYLSGSPDASIKEIMRELSGEHRAETSRWQDTWQAKTDEKTQKVLIRSGKRKGTLRLNI